MAVGLVVGLAALVGCALGTITLAARRALASSLASTSPLHHPDDVTVQLSGRSGLWLAIGASASLMAFFYRPDLLALLGMLSVCATGFLALVWTLDPIVFPVFSLFFPTYAAPPSCSSTTVPMPSVPSVLLDSSLPTSLTPSSLPSRAASLSCHTPSSPFSLRPMARGGAVTVAISVLLIVAWFLWQHWILNNSTPAPSDMHLDLLMLAIFCNHCVIVETALGVAMCVLFVSLVRVPSLKVSTAVLGSLFLYDIFWVFYSHLFFGENVMLAVATHEAQNPAALIAEKLNIDANVSPSLQLPAKLIVGPLMLGLGDVVLPGLLGAFSMRFGYKKTGRTLASPHYLAFLFGYLVGLVASFVAVATYHVAQPALLYIVPSTLGALGLTGFCRNELHELWEGFEMSPATEERYDV